MSHQILIKVLHISDKKFSRNSLLMTSCSTLVWSAQFIIKGFKTFCGSILACSFRSFIVLCCYLIWYISDVGSSEWHSIHTSIFRYSWSVFWLICFLYLNCSDCSCSDYTEVSDSSTLFFFPFSQFSTITFSFYLLKLAISHVIPKMLLHF